MRWQCRRRRAAVRCTALPALPPAGCRATGLVLGLLLLVPGACTIVTVRHGKALPSAEALVALRPGETSYAQACALLGPPDDELAPVPWTALRANDPARARVLVERELLGRRARHWADDVRTERRLEILPVLTAFSWTWIDHESERLAVVFDERGVLQAIGRSRPAGEAR